MEPRSLYDRVDVAPSVLQEADLIFHCSDGAWKCPGDDYASSHYVQKTAKYSAEKNAYVVVVESEEVETVIRAAWTEPKSPASFLKKVAAWDFLAMRPSVWTVGRCLQSVTKGANLEFGDVRPPDVSCTRLSNPGWLLRLKTGGEPSFLNVAYDGSDEDSAPPPPKRAKSEGARSGSRSDFREHPDYSFDIVQQVFDGLVAMPKLFAWESDEVALWYPSPFRSDLPEAFTCAYACLLLHAQTIHGALRLLKDSCWLFDTLKDEWACAIVYQSLRCLYAAENSQVLGCRVPLRTVKTMQQLYISGRLSLECLIPREAPTFLMANRCKDAAQEKPSPTHVLPGRLPAGLVPKVFDDEAELLTHAYAAVPWLQEAMEGPVRLHLTGSFLCSRRGNCVPFFDGKGPGDVDLFCLQEDDVLEARAQVEGAMRRWARGLGDGGVVIKSWLKPTKKPCYGFEACLDGDDVEAQGKLDAFQPAAKRCDLYVNSPKQVMQYHLPQMRACLASTPTVDLFIAPTCAIAWICMVNVDYEYFYSRVKTPFQIIAKRWLEGFVLCLQEKDACILTCYLESEFGAAFRAKGCGDVDEIPSFSHYFYTAAESG